MFKASVQEARLMWGGTLGQRFWRLLVIRMAAGWLWRWCRACDELKLRFAMECRSCSTWRNAVEAIEGFDSGVGAVGRGPSSFAFPMTLRFVG
jgi:hypothetical protein